MKTYFLVIIFAAILGFYIYTLYPSCAPEDSGEYIAASYTLGIAHAPGNPLYIILGKIFSLIPVGNTAYRINLLSSILALLTLIALFKTIELITGDIQVSAITVIFFAFTYEFWYITTFAKTFTLITFLSFLCLYSLLFYLKDTLKLKYLYLSFYLAGFSVAGHYFLLMFTPVVFSIFAASVKEKLLKVFVVASFLFTLGFSLHLFLPIRSSTGPLINTGKPDTMERLYNFLTRKEMSGFKMSNLASSSVTKNEILLKLKWFLLVLNDHFTLLWLAAGIPGFFILFKHDKKIFYLIVALILFSGPLWLIFSAFPVKDPFKEAMNERYLPAFEGLFSILVGVTLSFLLRSLNSHITKRPFLYGCAFILCFLPLFNHFTVVNKRNNLLCDDYCVNFFKSVKPDSILFVGQHLDSIGRYMKYVRKKRQDIVFVSSPGKFNDILENSRQTSAPVYADPSYRSYLSNSLQSCPVGLACLCNPLENIYDYGQYERPWQFYVYRGLLKSGCYKDFFSEIVLIWYMEGYAAFGDVSLSLKKDQQAIRSFRKCISFGVYDRDIIHLRTYNYNIIKPRSEGMYHSINEVKMHNTEI